MHGPFFTLLMVLLLASAVHAGALQLGHTMGVTTLCSSPHGKLLATAARDARIILWDVKSGSIVRHFPVHEAEVLSLSFSADGSRLASTGRDGTARVWKVADGRCLATLGEPSHDIWSVAISPDGRRVATGGSTRRGFTAGLGVVRLWDVESGRRIASREDLPPEVYRLRYAPDGRHLLCGSTVLAADTLATMRTVSGAVPLAWSGPDALWTATGLPSNLHEEPPDTASGVQLFKLSDGQTEPQRPLPAGTQIVLDMQGNTLALLAKDNAPRLRPQLISRTRNLSPPSGRGW